MVPASCGIFWLLIGLAIFAGNLEKYLQWNYVAAWFLMFGIPCAILFKLSFHESQSKPKMAPEMKALDLTLQTQEGETRQSDEKTQAIDNYDMEKKEKWEEELKIGIKVLEREMGTTTDEETRKMLQMSKDFLMERMKNPTAIFVIKVYLETGTREENTDFWEEQFTGADEDDLEFEE